MITNAQLGIRYVWKLGVLEPGLLDPGARFHPLARKIPVHEARGRPKLLDVLRPTEETLLRGGVHMLLHVSLAAHTQAGVQVTPQYEQQGLAGPRRGPVQAFLQLQGPIVLNALCRKYVCVLC